jgi:hypothetical protein
MRRDEPMVMLSSWPVRIRSSTALRTMLHCLAAAMTVSNSDAASARMGGADVAVWTLDMGCARSAARRSRWSMVRAAAGYSKRPMRWFAAS